uniref:Galectin domain-containing protein n=1 Tax=Gorilla gorilla gorilla TaxID=9595 RepID=G3SB24_GORGO
MAVQSKAFCAGGLAPGWNLLVQGHADSGEDRFETNFLIEVSWDAEHFHVYAPEHKVLQFPRHQRPLGAITRVRVLSDHCLAQVELAKRGLSWGDRGY